MTTTHSLLPQFLSKTVQRAQRHLAENDYLLSFVQQNNLHFALKKAQHPQSEDARLLETDIVFIREKDPALAHKEEAEVFLYKSLTLTFLHRIAHRIYETGDTTAARLLSEANREMTSAEIHPGVQIGHHIFIDHPSGLIVGESTSIGNYFHGHGQVLLGSDGVNSSAKRHPTIGDYVTIWPKASVLGAKTVGNNVIIGAAALVTEDVPDNSTVVGHNLLVKKNGISQRVNLRRSEQNGFVFPQPELLFAGNKSF